MLDNTFVVTLRGKVVETCNTHQVLIILVIT